MRFFVSLFFSFVTFYGFSQYSIRGIVLDATNGAAIPGATVYIPDLKKGTLTDIEGNFIVENLPPRKFLVQFKFLGYGTVVKTISAGETERLEIRLNSAVTELTEIVISGLSHSTELKKNPIPISTLSRAVLEAGTSNNIVENLSQEPGVYHVSTGVAVAKPVIRGLGYNRIVTIYDGVRQEGQQWGDEHGIEIDEFSVDRVEIIKGAGSLLYGSDGLGGVLNFLPADPMPEGTSETRSVSNYQTNNGLISNSIMNAGNKQGWHWRARASHKTAHAYKNGYDGYVFNSGFNERDFSFSTGLHKSWGFSQLSYSSFRQNIGLVEGDRNAQGNFIRMANVDGLAEEVKVVDDELKNYEINIPRQGIHHQRFSSNTNLYYRETRFQLNMGYQQNVRKEFGDVLKEDQPNLFFDLKTASYNLTVNLPAVMNWDISFSTSGMHQQNNNKGLEFLIPEYRMFDWGAVIFVKKNFNQLDIAGGLRFDHRRLLTDALYLDDTGMPTNDQSKHQKFKEGAVSYQNYSASAGLTYQFSEFFTIKLNTSRGFRAPNISELTSNGMHEGSLRYEYGNFELQPETSLQADLGLLFNTPHISAEASVYQNNIHHFIYTKKLLSKDGSDSLPDLQNPYPAYTYTQGKARLTGGEFSIDLHPHPLDWLHFENALSLVYTRNLSEQADSSKYLPLTPAPRWQSEIRTGTRKWKNFSNIFFKIEYQYNWAQNRVLLENGTETPTPAYRLWNIGCGFDMLRETLKISYTTTDKFYN